MEKNFEKIVAYAKNRGFVFSGSEIYGGLANTWDFGPLGVELKNNLKKVWWKKFVSQNKLNVGLDSAIIMNKNVWVSSGHVGGFSDPLMDCKECKERFRADKLIEEYMFKNGESIVVDGWENEKMLKFIDEKNIVCPSCGSKNYTDIRNFNLMFKTHCGVTEESKNEVYLRPETAQAIFINFKNIQRSSRKKLPFGIGQIGKSFRNEITPGNFIFRTREFEQMEVEFFCKPDEAKKWHDYWIDFCYQFLLSLGIDKNNLKVRNHNDDELSHYSDSTSDIEYKFPFGFGELWGIANRTDFDLKCHQQGTNQDLEYFDQETNEKYLPYVIEPSLGLERLFLAVLFDCYVEEKLENGESRTVLKIKNYLAPIKIGVLPLSKKLKENALKVFEMLNEEFECDYDESGSIGKRYRRFDEIGTPYCVTYDFNSEENEVVTVRDRDTMEQENIKIEKLMDYFRGKFKY